MGALEFEPPEPKGANTTTMIEVNDLVDIANDILAGRKHFSANLSADEEKALLDILKIGIFRWGQGKSSNCLESEYQ